MSNISISIIDTNRHEGRWLMAALAKISTESQTDKEPDIIFQQVATLAHEMYKDAVDLDVEQPPTSLSQRLASFLNKENKEGESNTPDFILSVYMTDCLNAFSRATRRREHWYDKSLMIEGVKEYSDDNYTPHHAIPNLKK